MWAVDVFDVRGGYALCGRGKKMRNGSTSLPGARGVLQRDITGLARASCMAFLAQRRCGVPICQEVGTKALLG